MPSLSVAGIFDGLRLLNFSPENEEQADHEINYVEYSTLKRDSHDLN